MQVPFLGSAAIASGELTPAALRRWYRPIFRNVYVPVRHQVDLWDRLKGLMLAAPDAVVTGVAASAVHGAKWVDADTPIEVISSARPQSGLIRRRETLYPDEITVVSEVRVATVPRTAFDLARHLPRDRAVARLDALMGARRFRMDEVHSLVERHPGSRGLRRLRIALPLVDGGAESPRETRLRLLFIDAGLPAPTTQVVVRDELNRYIRRIDMVWEEYKVGAEYDGAQHLSDRTTYANDVKVERVLRRLGWHVVHVIREDRPADIVTEARNTLLARGWIPE